MRDRTLSNYELLLAISGRPLPPGMVLGPTHSVPRFPTSPPPSSSSSSPTPTSPETPPAASPL
ncbi:hypothetical protein [Arenibaculum sp.]|jgi:hypothetical protein|uniref:hypothetical protein n=1 Tax=Arenibaculum sp. TaxID=2865862 RepID=UPI002E12912D|nr:hypothetical protein [Arenibaculum sp.]